MSVYIKPNTSPQLLYELHSANSRFSTLQTQKICHDAWGSNQEQHLPGHVDGKICSPYMCLVRAAAIDRASASENLKIATQVWQLSRPPTGFSTEPPIVSARRVQVTRAKLTGKLKLQDEPVLLSTSCGCLRGLATRRSSSSLLQGRRLPQAAPP